MNAEVTPARVMAYLLHNKWRQSSGGFNPDVPYPCSFWRAPGVPDSQSSLGVGSFAIRRDLWADTFMDGPDWVVAQIARWEQRSALLVVAAIMAMPQPWHPYRHKDPQ